MVAARIFLQNLFIEQIIDENVAVLVGDEQIFAQNLHIFNLRPNVQSFRECQIAVIVEVNNFRPAIERNELLITDAVQTGICILSLHVFVISYGFLFELSNRRFKIFDRGHTGFSCISQLFDDSANLMLLFEQERDLVAVDSEFMDGAVAVVDGISQHVVEFLVKLVVRVDGSGS